MPCDNSNTPLARLGEQSPFQHQSAISDSHPSSEKRKKKH